MTGILPSSTTKIGARSFVGTHILICGASGQLGSALARQLAQPGTRLTLWGRRQDRLNDIAQDCRALGAAVTTRSLDLSDVAAAVTALSEDDDEDPFDVVLLATGQGDTVNGGQLVEDAEQVTRLGIINYVAPAALAAEIAGRMALRRAGRIALVGTAAASHSLPFATAYSGSKAGLARFADALRLAVKRHGVTVTLVSPGFFAPDQGHSDHRKRPAEIPVGVMAERMIIAVARGRAELITPWPFAALRLLDRILPRFCRDRLILALPPP